MYRSSGIEIDPISSAEVLIVCVGNSLAGDDAAGHAVYERLVHESLPPGTQAMLLGMGGLALLEYLRAQPLVILVDAVQLGGNPGDVRVWEADRIPAAKAQAVSLHGIGLRETLSIAQSLYPGNMPHRVVLIGVEGRCFHELGIPLSCEVEAAVETVIEEIKRLITPSALAVC